MRVLLYLNTTLVSVRVATAASISPSYSNLNTTLVSVRAAFIDKLQTIVFKYNPCVGSR